MASIRGCVRPIVWLCGDRLWHWQQGRIIGSAANTVQNVDETG